MSSAESKAKAQSKAQSIILAELSINDPSYQKLLDGGFTGYTDSYLQETANYSKLTTTAKLNVVVELAELDKPGIEIFVKKIHKSTLNRIKKFK